MAKKIAFMLVLLLGLFIASVTAFADTETTNTDTALNSEPGLAISDTSLTGVNIDGTLPINSDSTTPNVGLNGVDIDETLPTSGDSAALDVGLNNEEAEIKSNEESLAEITSPEIKMIDYLEKYADLILNPETAATENIIANINNKHHNDLSMNPLSYVLTGSVIPNIDQPSDSPVVVLFFIKENGKYVPLYLTDNKSEKTNKLEKETNIVSYVDLLYLGADKTNDIRIAVFRKDDADSLVLGENLQITDIQITVPKYIIEGMSLIWINVMNSINLAK